ncbi:hypothetical protein ACFE04_007532 [Oxalis oulophora]
MSNDWLGRRRPGGGGGDEDDNKGLLWKLPEVRIKDLGKVGPAFGLGAGCGIGFGFGLLGGAGIGPGIPGLQLGFGLGVGCGVGFGFGYGLGKGVARDQFRRYSNVGKLIHRPTNFPSPDEVNALLDELVSQTKRIANATSRELEKWRR